MLADLITGLGNVGIGAYNNEENQAMQQYIAGKTLLQQKEMQEKMLSLQTEAQKKAYLDSLLAQAKRQKNLPYWIAGGVLGVTIIIALVVVFSKKNV